MTLKSKAISSVVALIAGAILWLVFKETIKALFWGTLTLVVVAIGLYLAFKIWRWRRKSRRPA